MNSVKDNPFGNSFLILGPKLHNNSIGVAAPNAYPITAPKPPHVAADAGPNNIHAPKADAAPEPQAFRGSSFLASVSHWFHSMFVGTPPPAPVPVQLPPVDPNAGRPPFSTQNIEKTARSINTPWSTGKSMELRFPSNM